MAFLKKGFSPISRPTLAAFRSTSLQDSITIRPATPTDFKEVIELDPTVHWGIDYLPSTYHRSLRDPTYHALVGQDHNGKIVAFTAGEILDGGRTLLYLAGRVLAPFRGRDLSRRMMKEIQAHFRSQGAQCTHETAVTKDTDLVIKNTSFVREFEEVLRRTIMCFEFAGGSTDLGHPLEGNQSTEYSSDLSTAHLLNVPTLRKIMTHHQPSPALAHAGVIVNWRPLLLELNNIRKLISENSFNLISVHNRVRLPSKGSLSQAKAALLQPTIRPTVPFSCRQPVEKSGRSCTSQHSVHLRPSEKEEFYEQKFPLQRKTTRAESCERFQGETTYPLDVTNTQDYSPIASPATLLTFGNHYWCSLGLAYNVDVHSLEGEEVDEMYLPNLRKHLSLHVNEALRTSKGEQIIMFVFLGDNTPLRSEITAHITECCAGHQGRSSSLWLSVKQHLFRR